MKGERGFALVITLLITALLVALTVEFVSEVFVDTSARQGFTDGQQASLLAESGMEAAIKILPAIQSTHPGYTSLADLEQLGKLLNIEDEKGGLRVTAEEESGKVNLNLAWGENGFQLSYGDVVAQLVENSGLSSDLLFTLADWRDTTEAPFPAGAETPYYSTLKPSYTARNGKFSTVEELRLIKGIDSTAFNLLRRFVTVYDCPKVNINTAPEEVIVALDEEMTAGLAKSVVDYRKTQPFKDDVSDLKNVPGMSAVMVERLRGVTDVTGKVFRIHSEAKVNETIRIVEAVVNNDGQILYWREY